MSWNSFQEFVNAQQAQPTPPAPQQANGPRLPSAFPLLLRQLSAKSPQQIMLVQAQFNQQVQGILQQRNKGIARRGLRSTMLSARDGLQNFGQPNV